jgi:RNA polymerase sigma-70 factor, ECF subfamily
MSRVLSLANQPIRRESMKDTDPPLQIRAPYQFEAFYRAEYSAVVALTMARSGSFWAAEDLAQEAFLRAHRDWDHVSSLVSPEAWVRRVAINLAHSRFRRLRSEAMAWLRLAADAPTLQPLSAKDETFWQEVRRLPKRQADAIVLYYIDDLSVGRIAKIMDTAEGTVRALLHQGRTRLKRQLVAKDWFTQ